MSFDTETLKAVGYDALKTSAGVFSVRMLDIPDRISSVAPNVPLLGPHAVNGAAYALSRDVVDKVSGGPSKILNGDYMGILDNSFFFSFASYGAGMSGLSQGLVGMVQNVPLDTNMQLALVEGATITGATVVANYLDGATGDNVAFDFIRRPVSTTVNMFN